MYFNEISTLICSSSFANKGIRLSTGNDKPAICGTFNDSTVVSVSFKGFSRCPKGEVGCTTRMFPVKVSL